MKKLAPILAAIALASSGGVLADTGEGVNSVPSSQDPQAATPDSPAKPAEGFVLIQRNIYVPVDAEGKVASNEWVVIDRQDYVTAEELKAAQAQNGDGNDTGKAEQAPQPEQPARQPSLPGARGKVIAS